MKNNMEEFKREIRYKGEKIADVISVKRCVLDDGDEVHGTMIMDLRIGRPYYDAMRRDGWCNFPIIPVSFIINGEDASGIIHHMRVYGKFNNILAMPDMVRAIVLVG
jgi:hypothetical protein